MIADLAAELTAEQGKQMITSAVLSESPRLAIGDFIYALAHMFDAAVPFAKSFQKPTDPPAQTDVILEIALELASAMVSSWSICISLSMSQNCH